MPQPPSVKPESHINIIILADPPSYSTFSYNPQNITTPTTKMSALSLSRSHSREMPQLSIEQTYSLAYVARRKSSSGTSRQDLRQRLGTAQLLEAVEAVIRNSPPPSPQQKSLKPTKSQTTISWATLDTPKRESKPSTEVDEYGFSYEDEDEDDGLSLCRTQSRSP